MKFSCINKRIVTWSIAILVIVLLTTVFVRTMRFSSKQISLPPITKDVVPQLAIEHLSQAIQIPTISYFDENQNDSLAFNNFRQYIENQFPLVAQNIKRTIINTHSFIYEWKGTDNSLKPIILTAHYDVVPIEESTKSQWKYQAFSGTIADGYIWGRGTMDDKLAVIGILESAELLLQNKFTPRRTIIFAFGCDEEVRGKRGAAQIVSHLKKANIEAEFVLDEGLTITRKLVPDIEKDVALIGLSEKGYISLRLDLNMDGGHASMPQQETTIEVMARAITRLRSQPLNAQLCEPILDFMQAIGPEMPGIKKMFFANIWLFKPFIIAAYAKKPAGNSVIRTTISPTIFSSGSKDNVLPSQATATINIRILPGETIDEVLSYCKRVINDDRIRIKLAPDAYNPSPISSVNSFGYKCLDTTIHEIFSNVLVAPSLTNSATDGRYYTAISKNVYRFSPQITSTEDLLRLHGINERIAVEDYKNCIRFYKRLMQKTCQ